MEETDVIPYTTVDNIPTQCNIGTPTTFQVTTRFSIPPFLLFLFYFIYYIVETQLKMHEEKGVEQLQPVFWIPSMSWMMGVDSTV